MHISKNIVIQIESCSRNVMSTSEDVQFVGEYIKSYADGFKSSFAELDNNAKDYKSIVLTCKVKC